MLMGWRMVEVEHDCNYRMVMEMEGDDSGGEMMVLIVVEVVWW